MGMGFKKPSVALRELETDNAKGIYFIKLVNKDAFEQINPEFHLEYVNKGYSDVIYIGKATGPGKLRTRLNQELRQENRATFFRSIGALIGAVPQDGQASPSNYMFFGSEEEKVINFIDSNIEVYYRKLYISDEEIEKREIELIKEMQPIINIQHNPSKSLVLERAREQCRQIAGEGVNSNKKQRKGHIFD